MTMYSRLIGTLAVEQSATVLYHYSKRLLVELGTSPPNFDIIRIQNNPRENKP